MIYAIIALLSLVACVAFTMLSGPALGVWFAGLALLCLARAEGLS